MLAANRDQLVASLRSGAQDLRWKELDSILGRYTGMIGVTSLGAGFAFSAMVELELPDVLENPKVLYWIYAFYMLVTTSLVLSLYVVSYSALAIGAGSRLALQGSDSSTTRAVAVLLMNFKGVFVGGMITLCCIIGAAMCIVYIKLQDDFLEVMTIVVFVIGIVFIFVNLSRLKAQLAIRPDEMVTGAVTVGNGGNMVDLTMINLDGSGQQQGRQDDKARLNERQHG